ncbi:MAG: hypothetical protein IT431_14735 [Phycisphaerales bacterium]|nr:hypothetical protein [Phycisphaerales bacterium]
MHPSETAFDRVKSLLGKMDRSIDDARRRRLDDHADPDPTDSQTKTDSAGQLIGAEKQPEPEAQPPRPASKYGRARPLREVNGNGASWQGV